MIPLKLVQMPDAFSGALKPQPCPDFAVRVDRKTITRELVKALKSAHGWPAGVGYDVIDAAVHDAIDKVTLGRQQLEDGHAYFSLYLPLPDGYIVRQVDGCSNNSWEFCLTDEDGEPLPYGESSDSFDSEIQAKIAAWQDWETTQKGNVANEVKDRDIAHERRIARLRQSAIDEHGCHGEIEFDDNAVVSVSDGGAYVAAWVWVDEAVA